MDIHADSWTDSKITALASWINDHYSYDSTRPEMKIAVWGPHGSGPHLHIQSNPFSKARVL